MSAPPRRTSKPDSSEATSESTASLSGPQPIFVQASSVGDSAAAVDELGFELYVNALADFLVAPNTRAPLTCSIEGSWGSGKSSFMLQLRNRLKTVAPNSRTIEFNAWKYDKQEELWAAFALNLTRSLRHQTHWIHRFLGDAKLYFSRIKSLSEALKLATFALAWLFIFGGVVVTFVAFSRASDDNQRAQVFTEFLTIFAPNTAQGAGVHTIHHWLANSSWAASGILILALFWKLPDSFRKRLFSTQIEQYIDKPDYKGKAAFLDTFSKDFARTVRAYSHSPNDKIFVFIDDLDRSEAPKAADLMQAINLLIGDGNSLIFILALDRAKVAAAIAFKFHEIIPYLDPSLDIAHHPASIRSFGDNFLEKFIQLSFRLPVSSNEAQAHRFIDSLMKDAASPAVATSAPDPAKPTPEAAAAAAAAAARRALRIESGAESQRIRDIVMMVREILEYSPRRIKSFLNAFRLALYIASAQGLLDVETKTGKAEVTPEKLGKFLALTSRYPELLDIAARDNEFFGKLEIAIELRSKGRNSEADGYADTKWLQIPSVEKLLCYRPVAMNHPEWARIYSLDEFPAAKFISVLPSVPPPADPQQTRPAANAGTAGQRTAPAGEGDSKAVGDATAARPGFSPFGDRSFEAQELTPRTASVFGNIAGSSAPPSSQDRPQPAPRQAPSKAAASAPSNSKAAPRSKAAAPARAPAKK